ncbi:MAG: Dabb family protein [Acidimicrobiia bacterium]
MTFRHTLMLRFTKEATEEQKQALFDGLASLPGQIDVVKRFEFGRDLGFRDDNPDVALVADFDSEEDWKTYLDHPAHLEVVTSVIRPIAAETLRVQYLVD